MITSPDTGELNPEDVWANRFLAKVVAILNRLPVLEQERQNVEWVARDLLFYAWGVSEENFFPKITNGVAKDDLLKFAKLSRELLDYIRSMDKQAHVVMSRYSDSASFGPHGYWSGTEEEWDQFARQSLPLLARHLQTLELIAQRIARRGRGRPRKEWHFNVANYAAIRYRQLTGKPLTISTREGVAKGPFVLFLGQLFEALEIKASAEGMAKGVVKKRKKEAVEREVAADILAFVEKRKKMGA